MWATRAPTAARGAAEQITRDHSLLQEQIDAGLITPEQAAFSANKNLVTRAVGVEDTVLLETHQHEVQPGDSTCCAPTACPTCCDDASIGRCCRQRLAADCGTASADRCRQRAQAERIISPWSWCAPPAARRSNREALGGLSGAEALVRQAWDAADAHPLKPRGGRQRGPAWASWSFRSTAW
jgi:hypothetical protein